MIAFPQIGNGSITQFPVCRSRSWRPINNVLESGERIQLPDMAADEIGWRLSMKDLSDTEASAITSFFAMTGGRFSPFVFVDPLANLIGWSEDFLRPDWQSGLITCTSGSVDPVGTQRASLLINPGAGAQSFQQSLPIPAEYVACFSAWVRGDAPATVVISRDALAVTCTVGTVWKRIHVSGRGTSATDQSTFSLSLVAGQRLCLWGTQVEAQPFPSKYRKTTAPTGIYQETYFASDGLDITSTGPGLSACELSLVSRG